jgi:hypothetical protein
MPISCPIQFAPLSTEEFGPLDYAVMAHAFASHQYLGSLADEQVYQLSPLVAIHWINIDYH